MSEKIRDIRKDVAGVGPFMLSTVRQLFYSPEKEAKKKLEQEMSFQDERFKGEAERFLDGCKRRKEFQEQRKEMGE